MSYFTPAKDDVTCNVCKTKKSKAKLHGKQVPCAMCRLDLDQSCSSTLPFLDTDTLPEM